MLAFQAEVDAFEQALPRLLAEHQEGQFAVLNDGAVVHLAQTQHQALTWAYENFGTSGRFFVKEISEHKQVIHFNRRR